jgi:transcriptional regulator with XRE-family HTH domain
VDGLEIKIARIRAGYKQYELAQKTGIPAHTLSLVENGRGRLSPEQVRRLGAYITVTEHAVREAADGAR